MNTIEIILAVVAIAFYAFVTLVLIAAIVEAVIIYRKGRKK